MSSGIVKEAILRVTLWGLAALPGRLRGDHRAAVAAASAARIAREEAAATFASVRGVGLRDVAGPRDDALRDDALRDDLVHDDLVHDDLVHDDRREQRRVA
jgi:hypothetical protein